MFKIARLALLSLVLAVSVGGCVVEPWGGGYYHHEHWRGDDGGYRHQDWR